MQKISIKRVLIGLVIGGIIVALITYLWLPVNMVVRFEPDVGKQTARSLLLNYSGIKIRSEWLNEERGYLFVVDVSHRTTGYYIKWKLEKEINVEYVRFGTFFPKSFRVDLN